MKINMVRVEVVGDVRRLAGPGLRFFCCCLLSHALARAPTPSTRSNVLCRETPSTRRAQKDAGSYFKRLELVLRLAHVGLEEGERAELLNSIPRISIYRIVPFMDLDAT